jgi:hypothetical protein
VGSRKNIKTSTEVVDAVSEKSVLGREHASFFEDKIE